MPDGTVEAGRGGDAAVTCWRWRLAARDHADAVGLLRRPLPDPSSRLAVQRAAWSSGHGGGHHGVAERN